MHINHISVSRLSVFQECQQQYKYKYHLKLEPLLEQPFYFVYGKVVHKIAEEYVRCQGQRLLKDVQHDILEGNIPIEFDENENPIYAPTLETAYKKRLPGHLRSIHSLTEKIGYEGELEYELNYDLDPPNKKMMKGFIDRLIIKGDKFWIIDYKTTKKGKFRKTQQTILEDLQLRAYARVVQKQFNVEAKNISAALYYLEGGNLIAARFSENSLEAAENILLNAYNEIVNTHEDKAWGRVGDHCKRCPWRKICPFYSLTG